MELRLYELGSILGSIGNYMEFQDTVLGSIKTDSRLVEPGDLFVCLQGNRFDGHSFAKEAVARGAKAIVSMKMLRELEKSLPIIIVRDTQDALLHIARHLRAKFQGKVIGITGSCGKTSTKEVVYSILSVSHKTGKNFKNWNNHIGIPLSIFEFQGNEDFWVLELGISNKNEMEKLAQVVEPDVVCIPNIGPVHLEGLHSIKGVAQEKSKILDFIRPGGFAVITSGYPELVKECKKRDINIVYIGEGTNYSVRYNGLNEDMFGVFSLNLDGNKIDVISPLNLNTFSENILAASTIAYNLGVDLQDIKQGIAEVKLPEHRNRWIKVGNFFILDDCYNANPMAMKKLFGDLLSIEIKRPLIAILGDMLELGDRSLEEHINLGRLVGNSNVDILFYKGNFYKEVKQGVLSIKNEMPIYKIEDDIDFLKKFESMDLNMGTIIAKASRGVRLETIVKQLILKIKSKGEFK